MALDGARTVPLMASPLDRSHGRRARSGNHPDRTGIIAEVERLAGLQEMSVDGGHAAAEADVDVDPGVGVLDLGKRAADVRAENFLRRRAEDHLSGVERRGR